MQAGEELLSCSDRYANKTLEQMEDTHNIMKKAMDSLDALKNRFEQHKVGMAELADYENNIKQMLENLNG